jgi:hypothetical protein
MDMFEKFKGFFICNQTIKKNNLNINKLIFLLNKYYFITLALLFELLIFYKSKF